MDPQQLGPILGLVALVGFIVLIAVWAGGKRKKIDAAFAGFAERHGLNFEGGKFPIVSGTIDGREVVVGNFIQRKLVGRPAQTAMPMFRIFVPVMGTLPADFYVTKRSGMARLAGGVKSGDDQLDKAALLRCSNEAELGPYLTEARKAAIHDLLAVGALVEDNSVYYEQSGFKPNADWIDDRYKVMYAAAVALDAS